MPPPSLTPGVLLLPMSTLAQPSLGDWVGSLQGVDWGGWACLPT